MLSTREQETLERIARQAVRELAKHISIPRDATADQCAEILRAMQAELEDGIKILTALAVAK